MSGGSLNYICHRVDDAAGEILDRAQTPLHRAFAAHLLKVGKALHDIEWLFSGDYGPGREEEAIRAVLHEGAELEAAIAYANFAAGQLNQAIADAKKARG